MTYKSSVVLAILVTLLGTFYAKPREIKERVKESLMKKYKMNEKKEKFWQEEKEQGFFDTEPSSVGANCINNKVTVGSTEYPCENVDMLSHISLSDLGCAEGNDVWGWTDTDNNEYVVAGCGDRTVFIDITDPGDPVVLGHLKNENDGSSSWKDVKVYEGYAFIGSEQSNHGIQIIDLSKLKESSANKETEFERDAYYDSVGSSHNIVINEESGYMYIVGASLCNGGLVMVDIKNPLNPEGYTCFADEGYTHDAQCVMYNGPDTDHVDKEICFCYNEDQLTIVDVTDKDDVIVLSRKTYGNVGYTHQGWINEDQTYIMLDDETDELFNKHGENTRTIIINIKDLDGPTVKGTFLSTELAIDHNQYILNGKTYQANYCAGLRVLDISNIDGPNGVSSILQQGYFQMDHDAGGLASCKSSPAFHGAWSNYPYFASGSIALQTIENGLYILKFNSDAAVPTFCKMSKKYVHKRRYYLNDRVKYKGSKYVAIKDSFKSKNPEKYSTMVPQYENKWEKLGKCICNDIQIWKYKKQYFQNDIVQFKNKRYRAQKDTKKKKPSQHKAIWKKLGIC